MRAELLCRFHGPAPEGTESGRTVGALHAAAEERFAHRQRVETERRAAEQAGREQAAEAARERRLQALAANEPEAWLRVDAMTATKKPKEYDAAVTLLADLKAVCERDGRAAEYRQRVKLLREQHARKPSLLDRLDRAGLGIASTWSDPPSTGPGAAA